MNLKILFRTFFLISLFSISLLFSIEEIRTNNIINNQRDYTLSNYEDETAISHWYGSDSWAVKFRAADFRPNVLSMTLTGINIYFPTIPDNPLTIRAFTYTEDSQYDPSFGELIPQLNLQNITIDHIGWNYFSFTSSYTGEGIWIIVDNLTNYTDNFMASASGSGANSYYKVEINGDVAFNSFYDLNIQQELLYSLDGFLNLDYDITADSVRVEILNVNLDYSHDDLWTYNFQIRNYSQEALDTAVMEIQIIHPDPEVYDTTYTYLDISLPPLSDLDSENQEATYLQLSIPNSQYKITSTLLNETGGYSLGSKMIKVCNFQEESSTAIIMNFISGNHQSTEAILALQRDISQPNWLIYNYGIDGSDQLFYSNYAYDYYQRLSINLNPLTLINGSKYFNSYNLNAMEENLENNIYYIPKVFDISQEGIEEEGNLLTYYSYFNYGERFVFPTFTDNLAIDAFISQETKHYSSQCDEFVVSEITDIYADFARLSEEGEGYFEFTYDTSSVDSLLTNSNGQKYVNAIIYREDTNEIISFYRYTLQNDILVSNYNHDIEEQAKLSLYPNPVRSGESLKFIQNGKGKFDSFALYNLKGQKVSSLEANKESLAIPKNIASGIYFLRGGSSLTKKNALVKVVIIKE